MTGRASLALALLAAFAMHSAAAADTIEGPAGARLTRLDLSAAPGFSADDARAAFAVFRVSCAAILAAEPALRPGLPASPGLVAICRDALALPAPDAAAARAFFLSRFTAWEVAPATGGPFLTGYYEPEVAAARARSADFPTPVLGRPDDLVTFPPGATPPGLDPALAAARRLADGGLEPYPDRAAIESGALGDSARPIAWLADPVEAFMIHVQGSARLRFVDGGSARLVYDGRNGRPYVSIGRLLATERGIPPAELTLDKLKAWIRAAGQRLGEDGLALLHRNPSFIFFRLDATAPPDAGPIGAQGVRLTPQRSLAVDRSLWPYGTPVWIEAELPWRAAAPEPFRRLMIAQDTGSAILGPARADLFFGHGEAAGRRAGDIRHPARFVVLLPKGETP
ncbi:MAG: MltA domain-containing protein [Methylobacteriaceae bacterium]|nr:MltA domain-containing protein [Methylobacteriaceae bacterium]